MKNLENKKLKDLTTHEIAQYLREDRKTAFILWQIADVHIATKNMEEPIELSDDDAATILDDIQNGADCNYGITWDTLYYAIEDYINSLKID
jgi:DNA-directed RNA polymerase specialized sigma subunit